MSQNSRDITQLLLQLHSSDRHHVPRRPHVAPALAAPPPAGASPPLHQGVVHEGLQQGQQGLSAAAHGAEDVLTRQPEDALNNKIIV